MELSIEQISELEERLKKYIPFSITAYTPVQLINEGLLQGFTVWTDAWPNFTAVVVRPDKYKVKNDFMKKMVFIFCPGSHAELKPLLVNGDVIDWKNPFIINAVPKETAMVADDIFGNPDSTFCHSNKVSFTKTVDVHCCLYKATKYDLIHVPKPDGITEGCITDEIVENVTKAWKFQEDGVDGYIRILLSMNRPSICLFNRDGEPVAWAIQQIHGAIAMLYVDPRYRRRGLGQYTQILLSKEIIKRDGQAFVVIEPFHYISKNLHEKTGFRKVDDGCRLWHEYTLND